MNRPRSVQEALNKALILVQNLQSSLPGKVGRILSCLDEVIDAWEDQDIEEFPISLLRGEVESLRAVVTSEYDDLDQEVDRRSIVYEQVVGLYHRLRMSNEFVLCNKVFEGVQAQYRRIQELLPARNYAFKDLLPELVPELIGHISRRKLEAALRRFEQSEYKEVLQECGEVGEGLFALFKDYLAAYGLTGCSKNVGPALKNIRRWFEDGSNKDQEGYVFSTASRIESFVLSLFQSLHYLRNLAHHNLSVEENVPPWQTKRRELYTEKPEYARLSLCIAFQIAIELQFLLNHQKG